MRHYPTKVNFDICTYCNHKCTFCSNSDERTLKESVTYEDFLVAMDNLVQYVEVKELGLSAKGEVLLNNDLVEIVRATKERYNIQYVYISTNGAILTKELSQSLLEAGLDSIKFSINAYDRESYKTVHKKDDFERVVQNFNELLQLKKERYPKRKVLISSIIDIEQKHLEEHFKVLFPEYKLIDKLLKYSITYTPKFTNFTTDRSKLRACPLVFNEIYIDADCRLGLCCKDYFKEFDYGSLLKHDFKELYESEAMQAIRVMHKKEAFEEDHFCTKCLMFEASDV